MAEFHLDSWIESAAQGARNPLNWAARSEELKRAADILRESWLEEFDLIQTGFSAALRGESPKFPPSVGAVAMFVASLCLENDLKGILVAKHPDIVQQNAKNPDELIRWPGNGHNLIELARAAGIPLSKEELELLQNCTDFITWAGRYPVPKKATQMKPRPGTETGGASFTSQQLDEISALHEILLRSLLEANAELTRANQENEQARRTKRRLEIDQALASLTSTEKDGIRLFHTDLASEPGAAIACGGCGAQFTLDPSTPAAICNCQILRYGEKKGVAGQIMFHVEEFG